jgi:hypothetical protein
MHPLLSWESTVTECPQRTGFGIPDAPTALGLRVTTHVVAQAPLATQGFTGQTAGQPSGGAIGSIYGGPNLGSYVGAAPQREHPVNRSRRSSCSAEDWDSWALENPRSMPSNR